MTVQQPAGYAVGFGSDLNTLKNIRPSIESFDISLLVQFYFFF